MLQNNLDPEVAEDPKNLVGVFKTHANAPRVRIANSNLVPELVRRAKAGAIKPDLVTDQTSAHDLINDNLPSGWVALSGDPQDISKSDVKIKKLFPENTHIHRWLGLGERHIAGLALNLPMVK